MPEVSLYINEVDRTSEVLFDTLRKVDNINAQIDTLDFTIAKHGDEQIVVPELGQEVTLDKGENRIFGGVITRVNETVIAPDTVQYHIECADYSQWLKRRLVTGRYDQSTEPFGWTLSAIVQDLIANYTDEEFTTEGTTSLLPIKSISFNRLTVAECLQKLADATSHVWYVDEYKDVHMFPKNAEMAPFNLTDTSANYIFNSLEIVADLTQVRNSIIVQGGEAVSDITRTEQLSGTGERDHFPLANKFSELPIVTVGGVPQSVATEYLADETLYDCMWNFNEKYIRFTAGHVPPEGVDNIEVTAPYLYPIMVRVAPPLANQYGTYEHSITDKSIRSRAEAIARARAELASYGNELYEGHFRTYTDGLRSGQVINIQSDLRSRPVTFVEYTSLGDNILEASGHGFTNGTLVKFSGSIPEGLDDETEYYVVDAAPEYFKVSLTPGGEPVEFEPTGEGTYLVYQVAGALNIDVLIQSVSCRSVDPMGEQFEYSVRFATLRSIGMIEYLLRQLRPKDIIVDDSEILLNFFPLNDAISFSDSLGEPSFTTGPYLWDSFNWGYGVWN